MAMSRAQFPEVMGFQEGGDASLGALTPEETAATDTTMQELLKALTESKFDTDVEKYKQTLESAMPPLRRPDFYDVASDLGAALLSAPSDAGAFRGIGIGLTNFNDIVKEQY